MSDEILSQDQMDALLSEAGFDGDSAGDDNAGAQPQQPAEGAGIEAAEGQSEDGSDSAQRIVKLFSEAAGSVISNLINSSVTISPSECRETDTEAIPGDDSLAITIPLTEEIESALYLVITKSEVALLSDLMTMGDGTAEYTDEHKEAIAELSNQIMGQFVQSVTDSFSASLSHDTPSADEFDAATPPFQTDASDMAVLTIDIEGRERSDAVMVIPNDVKEYFASKSPSQTSGDEGGVNVGLNEAELEGLSEVSYDFEEETAKSGTGGAAEYGVKKSGKGSTDMLLDIELDIGIELGRTELTIKRILELAPGSIIELDRMAGEPVDLIVNGKVVAKGEVVVVDENFGIRIISLVTPEERIRSLR
jgi:flagellar motor switch protein FliN/FliY